MIKKNTKMIFEGINVSNNELVGGVPLSVGEVVNVALENGEKVNCEVVDKKVDFAFKGEDQFADIVYILRRKK